MIQQQPNKYKTTNLPEHKVKFHNTIKWILIEDLVPFRHKVVLLYDGKKVCEGWRLMKKEKGQYSFMLSLTKEKVYNIVAWAVIELPCL